MRRFLIGILATIGTSTLLLVIGAAGAFWLFVGRGAELPEEIVVTLDLREGVPEIGRQTPLAALGVPKRPTLAELVVALDRAGRVRSRAFVTPLPLKK